MINYKMHWKNVIECCDENLGYVKCLGDDLVYFHIRGNRIRLYQVMGVEQATNNNRRLVKKLYMHAERGGGR